MSDATILNVLNQLGLSEKEAAVYYATLSLGPSTVQQIAKEAAVKRTTAYSVIDSLKNRNLLRLEVYGVKELWTAANPTELQSLLKSHQQAFNSILPQLSALHKLEGTESVIKYYDGLEAVKGVYLDFLRSVKIGEDYLVLSKGELWESSDPEFFSEFLEKRGRLDIKVRMILTPDDWAADRQHSDRRPNETTRILNSNIQLTTNLVIIPSKVFIHQLVPPIMGMVIENPHIINMHREMYELIWAGLGGKKA